MDIDHNLAPVSKNRSMLPHISPDRNGLEDEVMSHAQQTQAAVRPSLVDNALAAAPTQDMTQTGTATVRDFLPGTRQLHSASDTTPTSQHKLHSQHSHTRRTMQNNPSTRVGLNEASKRENELVSDRTERSRLFTCRSRWTARHISIRETKLTFHVVPNEASAVHLSRGSS